MTSISNILDIPSAEDKPQLEQVKIFEQDEQNRIVQIPLESHIEIIKQIYPNDGCTLTPTVVYVARDTLNNREVILKKILKKMLDQEGMELAQHESKLQVELQNKNLVRGIGHYEEKDAYCIVMELLEFADYFKIKLIENYKPIRNETKIKMYLTDILNGLKYLHDQNIVHLDLKLENLYCYRHQISEDVSIRKVKIGDLGIAKKVDPQTKKVFIKNAVGTREYMAPEIKNNTEISLSCDIWSFGIIVYQMVTGYVPTMVAGFQYEKDAELPYRKRDWKKIPNADQLQQFLNRILKFSPEDRPTVDQLLQDPYLNQ